MNGKNEIKQQRVPMGMEEVFKSWETTSLTYGILSIVLCLGVGIGFGIAGIAYAKNFEKYRVNRPKAVWGQTLSIIGLVWSILVTIGALLVCLSPFIAVLGGILFYLMMRITTG